MKGYKAAASSYQDELHKKDISIQYYERLSKKCDSLDKKNEQIKALNVTKADLELQILAAKQETAVKRKTILGTVPTLIVVAIAAFFIGHYTR